MGGWAGRWGHGRADRQEGQSGCRSMAAGHCKQEGNLADTVNHTNRVGLFDNTHAQATAAAVSAHWAGEDALSCNAQVQWLRVSQHAPYTQKTQAQVATSSLVAD